MLKIYPKPKTGAVYVPNSTNVERAILKKALSFRFEGYYFSPAYKSGKWDGYERFINEKDFSFPIGLLDILDEEGIEYEFKFPETDLSWVKFGDSFLPFERTYQRNAIQNIIKFRRGIVKIPTRGGKTYVIAETFRILYERFKAVGKDNFSAVFYTDNSTLFYQAIEDFEKVTGLKIGKVKADTVEIKAITVVMIQTAENLISLTKSKEIKPSKRLTQAKIFKAFLKKASFVCVDEIQDFTSPDRRAVISTSRKFFFRVGLSATPWDNTEEDLKRRIKQLTYFGRLIVDVKESALEEVGVLSKDEIILILSTKSELMLPRGTKNKFNNFKERSFLKSYFRHIVFNGYRNELIVSMVYSLYLMRVKTLVIFSKVDHLKLIKKLTSSSNPRSIYGDTPQEERKSIVKDFLSGKFLTLLVSYVFKKGVTLPSAQFIINASSSKGDALTLQIRGRIKGDSEGKEKSIVIDFVDNFRGDGKVFNEHSLKRIESYSRQVGEARIHILDVDETEGNFSKVFEKLVKDILYGKNSESFNIPLS